MIALALPRSQSWKSFVNGLFTILFALATYQTPLHVSQFLIDGLIDSVHKKACFDSIGILSERLFSLV